MSTKTDPAFSVEGFSNWKKALTRFKTDEVSHAHRDALSAFNASKSIPIGHLFEKESYEASQKRRQSLLNQLRVLRTLSVGSPTERSRDFICSTTSL